MVLMECLAHQALLVKLVHKAHKVFPECKVYLELPAPLAQPAHKVFPAPLALPEHKGRQAPQVVDQYLVTAVERLSYVDARQLCN
jgi:hypothetical protein